MTPITWLRSYTQELHDSIEGINFNKIVVDDSEITDYLRELRSSDNLMLLGVVPESSATARDEDSFQLKTSSMFWVLEKTSDSNMPYDDMQAMWERTYVAAEAIIRKMMQDKIDGECATLRRLDPNSITITPVWKKASTNGWVIEFNLDLLL